MDINKDNPGGFFLSLEATFSPRLICPVVHTKMTHRYLNHARPSLFSAFTETFPNRIN